MEENVSTNRDSEKIIDSTLHEVNEIDVKKNQGTIAPHEKDELLSNNNERNNASCYGNNSDSNNNETTAQSLEEDSISVVSFIDQTPIASRESVISIESNGDELNLDGKPCFDSVSLSEPCCRVCQCNSNDEKLISPCFCSGSVKWIHESCLIQWMKSSLKDSCELCTKKIKISKRRKPFSKWRLPSQRPTPVLWVLVFITAIALNLASVAKDASRLCNSTPCLVFYAVGCIGVILGTLFLIYWSKRARTFISHWVELNEEWIVIPDNNVEKTECNTNKDANKLLQYCSITVHT